MIFLKIIMVYIDNECMIIIKILLIFFVLSRNQLLFLYSEFGSAQL